ncbi:MAG: MerR family transcriptional regulator [Novosphingobium sp.]
MRELLDIVDVVKRTGISSRALRYYESRGLIKPLRTQSGRRAYAAHDLERIHQIIALKTAGMTLADVGRLIGGRAVELRTLLEAQLSVLEARAQDVAEARRLVSAALSRIESGEAVDVDMFCSLIRIRGNVFMDVNWDNIVDRFWSGDAKGQFWEKREELRKALSAGAWVDLGTRIKATLPLDPASEQALDFVKEWYALLEPLRPLATKEMIESSSRMFESMGEWQGSTSPGFDVEVWNFIHEASMAAFAAGHTPDEARAWKGAGEND